MIRTCSKNLPLPLDGVVMLIRYRLMRIAVLVAGVAGLLTLFSGAAHAYGCVAVFDGCSEQHSEPLRRR
jgi:hypothetical protein